VCSSRGGIVDEAIGRYPVTPNEARTHFWIVVRACLVEFHQISHQKGCAKIRNFRSALEEQPRDVAQLAYHSEPFDVACRISAQSISLKKYIKRYFEIRDVENPLGSAE